MIPMIQRGQGTDNDVRPLPFGLRTPVSILFVVDGALLQQQTCRLSGTFEVLHYILS